MHLKYIGYSGYKLSDYGLVTDMFARSLKPNRDHGRTPILGLDHDLQYRPIKATLPLLRLNRAY